MLFFFMFRGLANMARNGRMTAEDRKQNNAYIKAQVAQQDKKLTKPVRLMLTVIGIALWMLVIWAITKGMATPGA